MKNHWLRTLIFVALFVLAFVLGKVIGDVCASSASLYWLSLGLNFGVEPFTLDLAVFSITFGAKIGINIAQSLLLLAAIFIGNSIRIRG